MLKLQAAAMPAWLLHGFWKSELQAPCLFANTIFSDLPPHPTHHFYRGLIIKTLPLFCCLAANMVFTYMVWYYETLLLRNSALFICFLFVAFCQLNVAVS